MGSPPVTGDQQFVKNINRMAILRLMRESTGLSRADLSVRSGLTRSTVSALVKELIDEGWLLEADSSAATGALGRRPTPLSLDGARIALLGADLGPDAIRIVQTSILGDIQESTQAVLRSRDPEAACHQLVEMVTALSTKITRSGTCLLGIGIGLHGALNKRSGILEFAPNHGWRNLDVGGRMAKELASVGLEEIPVYYQNEADLAAVGETEFGERPAADPLVYVSCSVGVGSGIILNESLFTGATGSAGEIGHTTLVMGGTKCSCGRNGCAEAYIGLRAIARNAGCLKGDTIDRQALQHQIRAGDANTLAAFASAGRALGVLLQNAWTTFNPRTLVLGGEVISMGGSAVFEVATQVLQQYAADAGLVAPTVRMARFGELATAVGAAAYVLHVALSPHHQYLHTPYSIVD